MKKIKAHINSYCTFCKAEGIEKVRAEWQRSGYDNSERACEKHKGEIKPEKDEEPSEADYQTWMRL